LATSAMVTSARSHAPKPPPKIMPDTMYIPFCVRLATHAQCARGLRPPIAQPRVRLVVIVCLGIFFYPPPAPSRPPRCYCVSLYIIYPAPAPEGAPHEGTQWCAPGSPFPPPMMVPPGIHSPFREPHTPACLRCDLPFPITHHPSPICPKAVKCGLQPSSLLVCLRTHTRRAVSPAPPPLLR
jgi:hypothetical protein